MLGGDGMAIDRLQEKIRKTKNPSMVDLGAAAEAVPGCIMQGADTLAAGYGRYCRGLLTALKGIVPAVRFSFAAFALLGPDGLEELCQSLKAAAGLGYYVVLDGPEILSPEAAERTARAVLSADTCFPCDAVVISGYLGSDIIKPFLPYCKDGKKDLVVVVRSANRSASELQDLLAGSRLVHTAAADYVNRYGGDTVGKFGYSRVGILVSAGSAQSLRTLRGKYPQLFMLVDGYDCPGANAKNCAPAFDKFGHGAVVCGGSAIAGAWRQGQSDGTDFGEQAQAAAQKMKNNLKRYVTVL